MGCVFFKNFISQTYECEMQKDHHFFTKRKWSKYLILKHENSLGIPHYLSQQKRKWFWNKRSAIHYNLRLVVSISLSLSLSLSFVCIVKFASICIVHLWCNFFPSYHEKIIVRIPQTSEGALPILFVLTLSSLDSSCIPLRLRIAVTIHRHIFFSQQRAKFRWVKTSETELKPHVV